MTLRLRQLALVLGLAVLAACSGPAGEETVQAAEMEIPAGAKEAIFAGGCFWCMEPPFDEIDGVYATISGYTGGEEKNPTYEDVSYGRTRHREAVKIVYDPKKVSYDRLLEVFWHNIDPYDPRGQFCDKGYQYTTAIYATSDEQLQQAKASLQELKASGKLDGEVFTEIAPAKAFYPAEDYHQDFYKKNPVRYKQYRIGCGRDARLQQIWGADAGH